MILYRDDAILVCRKAPGLLAQAGKPGEETMLSVLKRETGSAVFPVHRLDRETGGLMVFAGTAGAAAGLSRIIQAGCMKKEYLAAVHGRPAEPKGTMEDLLYHDPGKNKTYVVTRPRKGVRRAKLNYLVLDQAAERSLVQVRLHTGRTHQIRTQFAAREMPLLGDRRYGGGKGDLALWSVRLTFPHPTTGELLMFQDVPAELGGFAPIPELREME